MCQSRSWNIAIRLDPSGSNLEWIPGAIERFTLFFAPIARPASKASGRTVSKTTAATEFGDKFNLLLGDHRERLEFLVPSLTADLGIHIEQACRDKGGVVNIENLSNDSVAV
jgi:hypothetical protein